MGYEPCKRCKPWLNMKNILKLTIFLLKTQQVVLKTTLRGRQKLWNRVQYYMLSKGMEYARETTSNLLAGWVKRRVFGWAYWCEKNRWKLSIYKGWQSDR